MSWRMTMKSGKIHLEKEKRNGRGETERNDIKIVLFGEIDSKETIKQQLHCLDHIVRQRLRSHLPRNKIKK